MLWVQLRKPWAEILDLSVPGRFQGESKITTVKALSNPNPHHQIKRLKRLTRSYRLNHLVPYQHLSIRGS